MAVALIVGGAPGLGEMAVRRFRAAGTDVLLIDEKDDVAATGMEDAPGGFAFLQGDLCDPALAACAVDRAITTFGAIDTLLVTASLGTGAPLANWTPALWERSIALNLTMPFFFAQAAAPHLAASANASIVFISSTASLRGQPGAHGFQAAKAGLAGLVRSLAAELGPQGVRVNALLPGWVDTPFSNSFWESQADPAAARAAMDARIPLRRHGAPAELVDTIEFLASPAGAYISGTALVVDGGFTAV